MKNNNIYEMPFFLAPEKLHNWQYFNILSYMCMSSMICSQLMQNKMQHLLGEPVSKNVGQRHKAANV